MQLNALDLRPDLRLRYCDFALIATTPIRSRILHKKCARFNSSVCQYLRSLSRGLGWLHILAAPQQERPFHTEIGDRSQQQNQG
jgi:hypothetical protein